MAFVISLTPSAFKKIRRVDAISAIFVATKAKHGGQLKKGYIEEERRKHFDPAVRTNQLATDASERPVDFTLLKAANTDFTQSTE